MEFHEKLQHLRKQRGLTQEQLAERLFVSRTAVSKWESGRGYPNLESLKELSKLFSVSIDALLSNDELIELAETENRRNLCHVSALVFGALDLIAGAFLFLPLFGQSDGVEIRAVPLLSYAGVGAALRIAYLGALLLIAALGAWELFAARNAGERGTKWCKPASLALCSAAILLFALSRQPYVTAFLFLFFLVKTMLLLREKR